MPDEAHLTALVSEINAADASRLRDFVDTLRSPDGQLKLRLVGEYISGLGLGSAGHASRLGFDPVTLGPDENGVRAFVDLLTQHPAFTDGSRRLEVSFDAFGPAENDPALFEARRDASEFIVAGALAAGVLNIEPEPFMDALMSVAIGPDAFSIIMREVLMMKPVPPGVDGWPIIPGRLVGLEEAIARNCLAGVKSAAAALGQAVAANTATVDANGITRLDPKVGCAGQAVTIHGAGFEAAQPQNILVLFPTRSGGCVEAQVQSWSDRAIVVTAPQDVGPGCVGFARFPRESSLSVAAAASSLGGELMNCVGAAAGSTAQTLQRLPPFVVPCPPCLPGNGNRFEGGLPVIDYFQANQARVEPNTPIVLSWKVSGATSIAITRTSSAGPFIPLPSPVPNEGRHALGNFVGSGPATATYQLTASNGCGTIQRSITVELRKTPALRITSIEVVQAIQRPDNSVRLVAGKRTAVRVFVDSGITDGFDSGFGKNRQPEVSGTVTVWPAGAGQGFSADAPFNPGGSVVALPADDMNRNSALHSLNFELPLSALSALSGRVRIDARVFVRGHEADIDGPWTARASTTVDFLPQPVQEVLPIMIRDSLLRVGPPTPQQYNAALQDARTRFPIADSGFIVNPILVLRTEPGQDLRTDIGWENLLTAIATTTFVFPPTPVGGIRTAMIPDDPRYFGWNGLAAYRRGGLPGLLWARFPSFLCRVGRTGTFAHEMGHVFRFGHAPCPPPGSVACAPRRDELHPGLPAFTDDVGMDIPRRNVIEVGRGELMSYCGDQSCRPGETRWPSTAFWDRIFELLPIG